MYFAKYFNGGSTMAKNNNNTENFEQQLWKAADKLRKNQILFIDARDMGTLINRGTRELTQDDILKIAQTYLNGLIQTNIMRI